MAIKVPPMNNVINLPKGTYPARCVKVMQKVYQFQDHDPQDGIEFTYAVPLKGGGEEEVCRHVSITIGKNSNLKKDMVAIHSEEEWNASLASDEAFEKFLMSTKGKNVLLAIETSTSATSGKQYSKFGFVGQLPDGMSVGPVNTVRDTGTGGQTGFESYGDKRDVGIDDDAPVFEYDLKSMSMEQRTKAQGIILAAGGGATAINDLIWMSPREIPALKKFSIFKIEDDDGQEMFA